MSVGRAASHFDNGLRYRDPHDPAQTALTPAYILDPVRSLLYGCVDLDPCTTPENPTNATRFFAPPQDGLALSWGPKSTTVFVNPPYGRAREPWVERCLAEAARGLMIVLLIPAHPDTRIFQRAAAAAHSVLFLRGRAKFEVLRPNRRRAAASHPSALLGFNVNLYPINKLGLVLKRSTA